MLYVCVKDADGCSVFCLYCEARGAVGARV